MTPLLNGWTIPLNLFLAKCYDFARIKWSRDLSTMNAIPRGMIILLNLSKIPSLLHFWNSFVFFFFSKWLVAGREIKSLDYTLSCFVWHCKTIQEVEFSQPSIHPQRDNFRWLENWPLPTKRNLKWCRCLEYTMHVLAQLNRQKLAAEQLLSGQAEQTCSTKLPSWIK